MSELILEGGGFSLIRCCAKCDCCRTVGRGYQITGDQGFVTLCDKCAVSPGCELSGLTSIVRKMLELVPEQ